MPSNKENNGNEHANDVIEISKKTAQPQIIVKNEKTNPPLMSICSPQKQLTTANVAAAVAAVAAVAAAQETPSPPPKSSPVDSKSINNTKSPHGTVQQNQHTRLLSSGSNKSLTKCNSAPPPILQAQLNPGLVMSKPTTAAEPVVAPPVEHRRLHASMSAKSGAYPSRNVQHSGASFGYPYAHGGGGGGQSHGGHHFFGGNSMTPNFGVNHQHSHPYHNYSHQHHLHHAFHNHSQHQHSQHSQGQQLAATLAAAAAAGYNHHQQQQHQQQYQQHQQSHHAQQQQQQQQQQQHNQHHQQMSITNCSSSSSSTSPQSTSPPNHLKGIPTQMQQQTAVVSPPSTRFIILFSFLFLCLKISKYLKIFKKYFY
jgi:hypothetical protein